MIHVTPRNIARRYSKRNGFLVSAWHDARGRYSIWVFTLHGCKDSHETTTRAGALRLVRALVADN